MKNQPYQTPQVLVLTVCVEDIICTSTGYEDGNWSILV